MSKRVSIVVTTIHEPRFLDGYVSHIEETGVGDRVEIVVIPDRKTPASVYRRCRKLDGASAAIRCPDIDQQLEFLERFPSLEDRMPFDTDHRRNIGFLMALDRGCDVLISIDDDNYHIPGSDFVSAHSIVGETVEATAVGSDDGWFNLCEMLETDSSAPVYPRGFPYRARRPRTVERLRKSGRVAINVGLWTVDPDVDAVTRLGFNPQVSAVEGAPVLLGDETWSPINTQNTALAREAVAAYWYVRMGFPLGGMSIDRFGDILSGYFCQKCVKAVGDTVRIGDPVLEHRRSPHNLFKDLFHELAGIVVVEDLLPWLMELDLEASTYPEAYAALAEALERESSRFTGFVWDDGGRDFLVSTAEDMRAWLEAIRTIG